MFHALYTAATGMTAQEINLDNIASNLANSSTSGFQARRVQFSDLLYQTEVMPGALRAYRLASESYRATRKSHRRRVT
jgi:flagellar basal-body rod protein FlgG